MHVGDNIRSLRKREGYDQAELAEALGVSKETVCRWETGKSIPRQRYVNALAKRFALTHDDLLSTSVGLAAQDILHASRANSGTQASTHREDATTIYRIGRPGRGAGLVAKGKALAPADVRARHPEAVFIYLDGHEMSRLYPEGSLLLVDPKAKPWNGCTVTALVDNQNIVVRRFSSGENMVLLSTYSYASPSPDIMVDMRRVRILGVVVWFQASRDLEGH